MITFFVPQSWMPGSLRGSQVTADQMWVAEYTRGVHQCPDTQTRTWCFGPHAPCPTSRQDRQAAQRAKRVPSAKCSEFPRALEKPETPLPGCLVAPKMCLAPVILRPNAPHTSGTVGTPRRFIPHILGRGLCGRQYPLWPSPLFHAVWPPPSLASAPGFCTGHTTSEGEKGGIRSQELSAIDLLSPEKLPLTHIFLRGLLPLLALFTCLNINL